METKVFSFHLTDNGGLFEELEGTGSPQSFDSYRAAGWRPIHWTDLLSGTTGVRYLVVMERGDDESGGGTGELEKNLRTLKKQGLL
ncbi:MAG: hypothetical protein ACRENA_16295 [Vulcanimicrobiaceae bacterium]